MTYCFTCRQKYPHVEFQDQCTECGSFIQEVLWDEDDRVFIPVNCGEEAIDGNDLD